VWWTTKGGVVENCNRNKQVCRDGQYIGICSGKRTKRSCLRRALRMSLVNCTEMKVIRIPEQLHAASLDTQIRRERVMNKS